MDAKSSPAAGLRDGLASPIKLETLRRNWEFQQVFRVGKSVSGREIVMYALRTRRKVARFGFSISKKVGCAVVRNRLRRRLREICRLEQKHLKTGFDLVLVARSDAAASTYHDLNQAFQQQAQRLGCWSEPNTPRGQAAKAQPGGPLQPAADSRLPGHRPVSPADVPL